MTLRAAKAAGPATKSIFVCLCWTIALPIITVRFSRLLWLPPLLIFEGLPLPQNFFRPQLETPNSTLATNTTAALGERPATVRTEESGPQPSLTDLREKLRHHRHRPGLDDDIFGDESGNGGLVEWSGELMAAQMYYMFRAVVDPSGVVTEIRTKVIGIFVRTWRFCF